MSAQGYAAAPVSGEKSQFDVVADGELVFSKADAGRFPEEDEVLRLLAPGR